MDDVAKAANVSRTTVSLVLSDKAGPSIPVATRDRVRAVAAGLGYVPNAMASGLRRRTSDSIGLISDVIATTPYAGEMIHGAENAAWAQGKLITLVDTEGDAGIEARAIEVMLARQVEGFIYATMFHQVIDPPAAIRALPVVLLDARATDASLPSVVPDDYEGARSAVRHLVAAGHRRIGFLNDILDVPAAIERLAGYESVLDEAGIGSDPTLVVRGSGTSGGVSAAGTLLDLPQPPSALFCFNDRMAMGAYRAARHRGLVIPKDVSIVGYDDQELIAPWLDPPLTTVALPHLEMGTWAVDHLLAILAGTVPADDAPVQHRMPCPLVERDSVMRLASVD